MVLFVLCDWSIRMGKVWGEIDVVCVNGNMTGDFHLICKTISEPNNNPDPLRFIFPPQIFLFFLSNSLSVASEKYSEWDDVSNVTQACWWTFVQFSNSFHSFHQPRRQKEIGKFLKLLAGKFSNFWGFVCTIWMKTSLNFCFINWPSRTFSLFKIEVFICGTIRMAKKNLKIVFKIPA